MYNLKEPRLKNKLSQKQVAELLEVSRTAYTKYETGVSEPPLESFIKLSKYYGVTVDYLAGVEPIKKEERQKLCEPVFSEHELEILNIYRSLTPQGQEFFDIQLSALKEHYTKNSFFAEIG